jgi:hypothetical protein
VLQAWLDGRLIVILDGWDECDRSCKDEMQRYITTMLLGRVSLVITSRPAAVDGDAFFGEAFKRFELEVLDVQKPVKGLVSHSVIVKRGAVAVGSKVSTEVSADWRLGAAQAHSATHVVHAALRQVLGPQALQSGSYNKPGYMRLDFSWNESLSHSSITEIEEVANQNTFDNLGNLLPSKTPLTKWATCPLHKHRFTTEPHVGHQTTSLYMKGHLSIK